MINTNPNTSSANAGGVLSPVVNGDGSHMRMMMMTVKELIHLLQDCDSEQEVCVTIGNKSMLVDVVSIVWPTDDAEGYVRISGDDWHGGPFDR